MRLWSNAHYITDLRLETRLSESEENIKTHIVHIHINEMFNSARKRSRAFTILTHLTPHHRLCASKIPKQNETNICNL